MHDTITIPEGTLIIEVIPGDYTTGSPTAEYLPALKVHGTVKAGHTYHIEMRRELRRLAGPEDAASAASEGITVLADASGFYYWRYAIGTRFRDKARTANGQRPGAKTGPKLETIADSSCDTFHLAHPGWEQYSLRLRHIRRYQLACDEAFQAERQFEQLAKAAQQLRHEHQLTDAETTLEVPR